MSLRAFGLISLTIILVGCNEQPVSQAPDPQAVLQAIPAADSSKYAHFRDMKNWQNPYLIVRSDGVAMFDAVDNTETVLKPDDLLPALAELPASKWPYGRVVAATEQSTKAATEQDKVAIRRNKGILGGLLDSAHIAVDWVPPAR